MNMMISIINGTMLLSMFWPKCYIIMQKVLRHPNSKHTHAHTHTHKHAHTHTHTHTHTHMHTHMHALMQERDTPKGTHT